MSTDAGVAIIGAGAAGIAAARRLAASHLSAMVLEATARIGGRAWTCEVAGMRLDLGCGWLHSADRNPWTRIAEGAGFVVDRRAPAWGRQYDDVGFSQTDQAPARRAYAAWEQRWRQRHPLATALPTRWSQRAVELTTPGGAVRAGAAILTISTAVLAGNTIRLPPGLDAWRHAAASLMLGRDEKLFIEIVGESSFAPETRVIGNPRDRRAGVYHIRPFGWPLSSASSATKRPGWVLRVSPRENYDLQR
jgi:choline dehydrogenase-like flavoprotein